MLMDSQRAREREGEREKEREREIKRDMVSEGKGVFFCALSKTN